MYDGRVRRSRSPEFELWTSVTLNARLVVSSGFGSADSWQTIVEPPTNSHLSSDQ
jgi:hypothetical protein